MGPSGSVGGRPDVLLPGGGGGGVVVHHSRKNVTYTVKSCPALTVFHFYCLLRMPKKTAF